MKNLLNFSSIQTNFPTAWNDFLTFFNEEFKQYPFLKNIDFAQLPFDMQLGIFLKYFTENGVELDICNTDYSLLPQTIEETFAIHEKNISHYS